jgi:sec-independent protein translocase protein TatC
MTKDAKNIIDEKSMNISEHLNELRKRIIFCIIFFLITFFICYNYASEIYQWLLQPLIDLDSNQDHRRIIYTNPSEAFVTYLKLSFYSAFFFSFPIFAAQFYLFLAPALYKKEKKITLSILFFVPFLFLLGAIIAYFFILPLALKFLLSFETKGFSSMPITLEAKISEYLDLVTNVLFGCGVAFQSPLCLIFLIRIGFLSINDLRKRRRYWIVFIFIVAAILSSPDVLSQLSLAIPMILLFEIAILISDKFFKNKK